MSKRKHSTKVPKNMHQIYKNITVLTDTFCKEQLNEDYQTLVRFTVAALCRKRPSPLVTGKIKTWACGIVYALGTINFLFDKSNSPYVSASDLASSFQISKSTAANKAKEIRELLHMSRLDHHWRLSSQVYDSPLAWLITLHGLTMDARILPRDIQLVAYEKGLIPYIHADEN